jgi:hypothetical protein
MRFLGALVRRQRRELLQRLGVVDQPRESQPRRSALTGQPVRHKPRALLVIALTRSRADHARDVRLEHLPLVIGESVVPNSEELTDDGRDALGMIRPRFASDVGNRLHDAEGVVRLVRALV